MINELIFGNTCGAMTVSALPQIAAAAALYIALHPEEFTRPAKIARMACLPVILSVAGLSLQEKKDAVDALSASPMISKTLKGFLRAGRMKM